jgi:hypothetical protein
MLEIKKEYPITYENNNLIVEIKENGMCNIRNKNSHRNINISEYDLHLLQNIINEMMEIKK